MAASTLVSGNAYLGGSQRHFTRTRVMGSIVSLPLHPANSCVEALTRTTLECDYLESL